VAIGATESNDQETSAMKRSSAVVLLLAVAGAGLRAQEPAEAAAAAKLSPGDPAPQLRIARWVKGRPVERFEAGKVYVVEFWSSHSSACRRRLRPLSQLQRALVDDGVTVICVASGDAGDSLAAVESVVQEQGDDIACTVAWDDAKATKVAFMQAAGKRKLPCTFVIGRDGRIAFIGRRWPELALAGIRAGDWEPKTAAAKTTAAKARLRQMRDAVRKAPATVDAEMESLRKDYPFVLLADRFAEIEFQAHLTTGALDRAYAAASTIVDDASLARDASALNQVAWAIVDPDRDLARRDLDLALRAAQKAVELTKDKDGASLDTLARVLFWRHDLQQAITVQEKAVQADPRDTGFRQTLDQYRAARPKGDGAKSGK
jgi:hypothetical protein